jgi:hypothetical protein
MMTKPVDPTAILDLGVKCKKAAETEEPKAVINMEKLMEAHNGLKP